MILFHDFIVYCSHILQPIVSAKRYGEWLEYLVYITLKRRKRSSSQKRRRRKEKGNICSTVSRYYILLQALSFHLITCITDGYYIRKYQRLIRQAKLTSPNVNKNSHIGLLRDIVTEIYDLGLMCIADLFQNKYLPCFNPKYF